MGAQCGIAGRSHCHSAEPASGIVFGSIVWATSYVVLPLVKLYKPIWEYDGKTLAKDLIAYLTFGLGTGAAFRLLSSAAV